MSPFWNNLAAIPCSDQVSISSIHIFRIAWLLTHSLQGHLEITSWKAVHHTDHPLYCSQITCKESSRSLQNSWYYCVRYFINLYKYLLFVNTLSIILAIAEQIWKQMLICFQSDCCFPQSAWFIFPAEYCISREI